jgi:hypothetical protein
MFYYIVSDKNAEMYQRSYSVINRRRSLVDDKQLVSYSSHNLFLLSILQHVIASKSNHSNTLLPNEMVLAPAEMYQRSYSVINRRRSLVDDKQLVKCINIFQPVSFYRTFSNRNVWNALFLRTWRHFPRIIFLYFFKTFSFSSRN